MEEAISTAQIEGAVTTVQAAKKLLRSSREPKNKSERMVVNSYKTIHLLTQRLDEPLSESLLVEIQESMTEGTLDDPDHAGRLRVQSGKKMLFVLSDRATKLLASSPLTSS
jgi:Fic family protein